jgi:hypothetical protein
MKKSKKNDRKRKFVWNEIISVLADVFDFDYVQITQSQFRISKGKKKIDVFPVSMRYHDIELNSRGDIEDIEKFIEEHFAEKMFPQ